MWSNVAIIVLNWNQEADTAECLGSLRKINCPDHEVILIDNGSKDNTKELTYIITYSIES